MHSVAVGSLYLPTPHDRQAALPVVLVYVPAIQGCKWGREAEEEAPTHQGGGHSNNVAGW